jgi:hypothetical protein
MLLGAFLCISATAQSVTLLFRGNNQDRDYRVLIDGSNYNSVNATGTINDNAAGAQKTILITNLSPGSHTIAVYNTNNTSGNGSLLYSNTFQLRSNYDMVIAINAARVSFSEKLAEDASMNTGNSSMEANDFAELLQEVKSNRYQSARVAAIREAVSSSDHFTVNQIRQLLTLVTAQNTRLELAKLSYAVLTDPANYTRLNTLFTTQASRNSLADYVAVQSSNSNSTGTPSSSVRSLLTVTQYNNILQNLNDNDYQSGKFNVIKDAFNNTAYAFTTAQIRQLLGVVTSETDRLYLAKLGYAAVSDPANFASLVSLFTIQANRNSLTDYIGSGNVIPSTTVRSLLTVSQYNTMLQNLNDNNYQSGKYTIIKDAFNNAAYAFTTAQIRQLLGVITSEPDRLYLAKQAYVTVSDPVNFASLLTLFTTQANRIELNSYIIRNGGTGGNVYVQTKTPMADADFSLLLRKAGNHILPWDKVTDVKAAFSNSQNYFTSAQARQLMYLVSSGNLLSVSESSRLELAKLSYSRITDPENFTQIIDLFTIQASRDELNAYVRLQAQN